MTALSTPRRARQNNRPQDTDSQHSHTHTAPDTNRASENASAVMLPISARQTKSASGSMPVRKKRAPYYPTGDGKPMAEDVLHRKLMAYCCDALETYFATRLDVLVAGNDFVYYRSSPG